MAQPHPQIPQNVSAVLSHLSSRPGVQSTLILSRKDGSIIQSTGLLAATSPSSLGTSNTANADNNPVENPSPSRVAVMSSSTTNIASSALPSSEPTVSGQLSTSSTQNNQPSKPSQAETLAAHIFAFMTSASGLALSLSGSGSTTGNEDIGYDSRSKGIKNGIMENGTSVDDDSTISTTSTATLVNRIHEREEDDEIKLLRLRTKKNEIVVVPDRKYLLCVVHDAAGAGAASSSGSGTSR